MKFDIEPVIDGLERMREKYSKETWANEDERKGAVMGLRMAIDYISSGAPWADAKRLESENEL